MTPDFCEDRPYFTCRTEVVAHLDYTTTLSLRQCRSNGSRSPRKRPALELHRSLSAQYTKGPPKSAAPQMPPCITAYTLDSEQLKTNYSGDNAWDMSKAKLPPVARTQGFGRYTTAVDASPAWRVKHLSERVLNLGANLGTPLNVAELCGINQDEWCEVEQELRRHNTSSSTDADSVSSYASSTTSINPQTGTKIARGFLPAAVSWSALSAPCVHTPANSGCSLSSTRPLMRLLPGPEGSVCGPPRFDHAHCNRSSTCRETTTLDSIEELQPCRVHKKKVEEPGEFAQVASPESAIASDASDDEDWADLPSMRVISRISSLSQMLEEQKRADSECALQRIPTNSSTTSKRSDSSSSISRGLIRSKTVKSLKSSTRRPLELKTGVVTSSNKRVCTVRPSAECRYIPNHVENDVLEQDAEPVVERSLLGNAQPHRRHRSATVIYCQVPTEAARDEGSKNQNSA